MYITGIIYKIVYKYNTDLCYIGSTFKTLEQRMTKHKSQYKYFKQGIYNSHYRIYDLFDKYGTEDFMIFELRKYKIHNINTDSNRIQLVAYEQLWINKERYNNTKLLNITPCYNPIRKQYKNIPIKCSICNSWIKNSNYTQHLKSLYCKKIYNDNHNQEEEEENNS